MFNKFSKILPTLSKSWLIFFLIILGHTIVGLVSKSQNGPMLCINYILGFVPFFIYLFIAYCRMSRSGSGESEENSASENVCPVDHLNKGDLKHIQYWPLMLVTLLSFIFIVDAVPTVDAPEWFREMMKNVADRDLGWSILSVGIIAPILEEFVFRGMIQRGLMAQYAPMTAILWSAVFFGAVHLNPWQAIPAILFGIFFGWVYYRTGSLWTTIMFHSVNNILSLLYSYFTPAVLNVSNFKDLFSNPSLYYIILLISIAVYILGLYIINKHIQLKNGKSDLSL